MFTKQLRLPFISVPWLSSFPCIHRVYIMETREKHQQHKMNGWMRKIWHENLIHCHPYNWHDKLVNDRQSCYYFHKIIKYCCTGQWRVCRHNSHCCCWIISVINIIEDIGAGEVHIMMDGSSDKQIDTTTYANLPLLEGFLMKFRHFSCHCRAWTIIKLC